MAKTVREVLEENYQHFFSVPAFRDGEVCRNCYGPVDGFPRCYSCNKLFNEGGVPAPLWSRIVPATIVVDPSPWYTMLRTYKDFQPHHRPVVASLTAGFLSTHAEEFEQLLGGPADALVVTPSKGRHRAGTHPLEESYRLLRPLPLDILEGALAHTGVKSERGEYAPEMFKINTDLVGGKRLVLLEDLWVSGRTCVSAGGALLEGGAAQVVVMVLARKVNLPNPILPSDHPYPRWITEPYDISRFPARP